MTPSARAVLCTTLCAVLLTAAAHAQQRNPAERPLALPISGLTLALPEVQGTRYAYDGSWELTHGGEGFDGYDVVDEVRADELHAGTWIMVGWYGDDCGAAVRDAAFVLGSSAVQKASVWGADWVLRRGRTELGSRELESLVMCTERGHRKQLLMYHHFVGDPAPALADAARVLAELPVPQRAYRAWAQDQVAPSRPAAVRNMGEVAAVRTIRLPGTTVDVALPDDGFIWLDAVRFPDGVMRLERMAPAIREIGLDLMAVEDCNAAIGSLPQPGRRLEVTNLPAGWVLGPLVPTGFGSEQLILCRAFAASGLVVGLLSDPLTTDLRELHPILRALERAFNF
jgi:hypothetical protein